MTHWIKDDDVEYMTYEDFYWGTAGHNIPGEFLYFLKRFPTEKCLSFLAGPAFRQKNGHLWIVTRQGIYVYSDGIAPGWCLD